MKDVWNYTLSLNPVPTTYQLLIFSKSHSLPLIMLPPNDSVSMGVFGDITGSVPEHCNKANHANIFWLPSAYTSFVSIILQSIKNAIALFKKTTYIPQLKNTSLLKYNFPSGSVVKNLPAMQETQETWVLSLDWEDPLEEERATHSSILAWEIPWTEVPDELQSMGCKESDTTEHTHISE